MEKSNIHTAINAVMQSVGYVKKSGSRGLNYTYAGEAALIEAVRPEMVANGVYMSVASVEYARDAYKTKNGTLMNSTIVSGVIRFTHAPSDTSIDVFAIGEGADAGDKSANKAMTGMYKYAIRQTFCIETGDDPDKYASEEQEAKPIKPAKQAAAKPATASKPAMTLEEAEAITNSDGDEYGSLETKTLAHMANSIRKAISANSHPEKATEYETKLAAIDIILKSRN